MSVKSKIKGLFLLGFGAAGGAAASYFLDPDRGRARRKQTADQLAAAARERAREVETQLDYRAGQARGAAYEAARKAMPAETPDDKTLKDRVESRVLGHIEGVAPGQVVVSANSGVVGLRGEVGTTSQIAELVARTRDIEGVKEVQNFLHLPGQEPPNVAPSMEASRRAAEEVGEDQTTRSFR